MQAATRYQYGPPSCIRIEDIPQPVPAEDEVLIKVNATTVNRTDCANLTAKPFLMRFVLGLFRPRQAILGTDFAGTIVAVGKEVNEFSVGDRVFGFLDQGAASQAEYTTLPANRVFRIPAGIDDPTAAASLEGAGYAYAFLRRVDLRPGQRVLINGATGAIGSALLQFVRQYEVEITTTCNTKNIELIKTLGADHIIDYTQTDFTQQHQQYDFILDAVGKSTFDQCRPLLKTKGTYISSELGPYAQNVWYSLFKAKANQKVKFPIPYSNQETIPYIIKILETGVFKPVIERTYPLAEIAAAYEYVLTGQKTGNVVLLLHD